MPARARPVETASQAATLLELASASWTLPTVKAYPLFVEPIPRQRSFPRWRQERAAMEGIPMADYILREALERPTRREVLEWLRTWPVRHLARSAAEVIRAERGRR